MEVMNIRQANGNEYTPNMGLNSQGFNHKEDFTIKGYQRRELRNERGDICNLYWSDKSGLRVYEERTYTRDPETDLPTKKEYSICWVKGGATEHVQTFTKDYNEVTGFEVNKKGRAYLIDKASMYIYGALSNELTEPLDPEAPTYPEDYAAALAQAAAEVMDFESLTDAAQKKYITGNKAPLIDILNKCTDPEDPTNYRAYITDTMQTELLNIIDI